MKDIKIEQPSFGGDVSDLLSEIDKEPNQETQYESMNPYGNPFSGKSPEAMVDNFYQRHNSVADLEILEQRLYDFLGIDETSDLQTLPEVYQQTINKIKELLSKN